MRWTTKALLLRAFSVLPGGRALHYGLQRHVTRTVRPGHREAAVARRRAENHIAAWTRFGDRPLEQVRCFEFGAGWHLGTPLALARRGVGEQVVTDLDRLARPHVVTEMAHALADFPGPPAPRPRPGEPLDDFLAGLGISYQAPMDATRTGLDESSFDLVVSAHVLEHVPSDVIPALLAECRRILRPGGIMSFEINYQDHYSGDDDRITAYDFLRYDDTEWSRFNPALHHQNRLRHHEYLELFERADLDVLDVAVRCSADDVEAVRRIPFAPRFAAMPVELVAIRMATVVLTRH